MVALVSIFTLSTGLQIKLKHSSTLQNNPRSNHSYFYKTVLCEFCLTLKNNNEGFLLFLALRVVS